MVTTLDLTEFSAICRTCLSKENLLPMFPNISKHNDNKLLDTFFTITGLKVKKDDGLPQNICKNCTDLFNSIQNFRTTCKDAETKLLNMREKIKDAIKKEAILPETTLYFMNEELNISEQDLVKIEIEEINKKYNFENKMENKSNEIHCNETKSKIIVDKKVKESKLYILDVTDSNQKRIICQLCQKRLLIKSFWTHMSRSHPGVDDRQVKCDLCNNYIMKEKMNRHKKLMHGNSFKCRYCKFEFKEKDTLVEHVASCPEKKKRKDYETSREMVVCDICSKTMQKGSLRVHKAIKHAGLGPVCDHCGKRFGNKLRLDEHYRAKHGYEKFKCSECEFQSASNIALRNHERRHRGEKPFVCETCGADFHAAYLLAQHRHSHRTDKRFKCDKCPASFKARNSLHTHTRACHTQTRVACSVCARAYSCRHYALKHMRAVHRYSGPVPPLHTHTAQDNHERRHRGEKPFVCETCGADFHAAYLLVQHRHSHRTDKRFKCDKCPASFKARNSLHTHTRACHTQTRVACSVCARAYSCRHYALKHMRAVHRYSGPVPPLHTHTAQDVAINK